MTDYEMSDEEMMIVKLEELQRENDRLKAQQTAVEPLLQTIRQQEQEITRLNSSLIGERQQNEKLLELAKNEKKLHEENVKLKRENDDLQQSVKNESDKVMSLQTQLEKTMTISLPDDALLKRVTDALKGVDDKARDIMLVHWINLGVAVIFVLLAIGSGYLSYSASKAAKEANNAVQNGIYDKDGWSMIPGSNYNEYTAATERPEWYAKYKQQHPDQAHY